MAGIDIEGVSEHMITAAKGLLGDKWEEAGVFAEREFRKFAQDMSEIARWKTTGAITEEQAAVLSRLHQRSMMMVLTALEGISLALAEKTINSSITVVRSAINSAIGWNIL